jgi:L-threonylcarbamoyladenylate synthase
MMGRVDYIIDGGNSDFGLESTIVKIESNGELTLLRPGKITPEMLCEKIGKVTIAPAVLAALAKGEVALSPGMKYRHYAPKSQVVLLDGPCFKAIEYIKREGLQSIAVIAYTEDVSEFTAELSSADIYDFGNAEDMEDHAHRLFAILRDADKHCYDKIYAPLPEKSGVGLALFNRMIRAAAYTIVKL